jgi:putative membrane-bound dehydrogenase-like protein
MKRFVAALILILFVAHRLTAQQNSDARFDELAMTRPLSPEESLKAMHVRPGMKIELVAAEPLVVDPVAFDWGPDGRLWVVEMRDYPSGMTWNKEGDEFGKPAGRVKVLSDTDGDGRYDKAAIFLDEIPFPTGVKVWRKGILVTAAPEILYAEDKDGDDKADERKVLYRGFGEGNQQHRVNGLRWGLENWLYVGNGDSGGVIKSLLTEKEVNVNGRDLRIRPDTGELDVVSGNTQFGRERDDWGNWFGNNNSDPLWHYTLDDYYLRRNKYLAPPPVKKQVSVTPGAAPVFPRSKTLTRFNDDNKANRFTSACGPTLYRDDLLGPEYYHNVFVCEPVHNLVEREMVTPQGSTFTSRRADDEKQSEFLASEDNWCRPSMCRTGPDGALWVADMYRFVIEHPKWIPVAAQKKLDMRAGDDKGRIYRIYPEGKQPRPIARLDKLDTAGLVAALDSPNGTQRDLAHQMLLWRGDKSAVEPLKKLVATCSRAQTRLQALCVADGLGGLTDEVLLGAMADEHPGVRRHAVRLAEPRLNESAPLAAGVERLVSDSDVQVRIQVAYTLGEWKDGRRGWNCIGSRSLADDGRSDGTRCGGWQGSGRDPAERRRRSGAMDGPVERRRCARAAQHQADRSSGRWRQAAIARGVVRCSATSQELGRWRKGVGGGCSGRAAAGPRPG